MSSFLPLNFLTNFSFKFCSSNTSDTLAEVVVEDDTFPRPRRNSIDLSSKADVTEENDGSNSGNSKKFENQVSDYTTRRHTDIGAMQRRDLTAAKKEYTTQMLRKEWEAEKEVLQLEEEEIKAAAAELSDNVFRPIDKEETTPHAQVAQVALVDDKSQGGKKKRRKKSVMKKKSQRKNSSSSGSTQSEQNDLESENNKDSNDSTPPTTENSTIEQQVPQFPAAASAAEPDTPNRTRELDHHFFSDTEAQSGPSPHRPSTPIQSDTEFENSIREKVDETQLLTNSASWKWGEFPTKADESLSDDLKETQRSMLGGMFSFMKAGRKMRKNVDGLYLEELEARESIDPEVAALYFPEYHTQQKNARAHAAQHEDDRESGNGTSVPQSPTSMEGIKSLDSDYDEKQEKPLDFVAISLCGPMEKGYPTDEEFRKHQIQFNDVSNCNHVV